MLRKNGCSGRVLGMDVEEGCYVKEEQMFRKDIRKGC